MIPVAVIARACARSVRAGVMRVAVGVSVGRSARRIVIVKSIPAVSSTRKERKRREETAQRWGFAGPRNIGTNVRDQIRTEVVRFRPLGRGQNGQIRTVNGDFGLEGWVRPFGHGV